MTPLPHDRWRRYECRHIFTSGYFLCTSSFFLLNAFMSCQGQPFAISDNHDQAAQLFCHFQPSADKDVRVRLPVLPFPWRPLADTVGAVVQSRGLFWKQNSVKNVHNWASLYWKWPLCQTALITDVSTWRFDADRWRQDLYGQQIKTI